MAVDQDGAVYLTDGNRIRKISPAGEVSTFAGSNIAGSSDGIGAAATFNAPEGLAVDQAGHLYVADTGNHKIRRITPEGEVSTWAGTLGSFTLGDGFSFGSGSVDGNGTSARFREPQGVATDAAGNVYVVDSRNHEIRKITNNGEVTTWAGNGNLGHVDGPGESATFASPRGLALSTNGFLAVADGPYGLIRRVGSACVVSTWAGLREEQGNDDGSVSEATFSEPVDVAFDAENNLYVLDRGNHNIRRITPAGEVTTLAGTGDHGTRDAIGADAGFSSPGGFTVDADGTIYVADSGNHRIRSGRFEAPLITVPPRAMTVLGGPHHLRVRATSAVNLYDAAGLPAGLVIDGSTGMLSGTPREKGRFDITLSATNGAGTGTVTHELTVVGKNYAAWVAARFSTSPQAPVSETGPDSDADKDRTPNLLEFVLGRSLRMEIRPAARRPSIAQRREPAIRLPARNHRGQNGSDHRVYRRSKRPVAAGLGWRGRLDVRGHAHERYP